MKIFIDDENFEEDEPDEEVQELMDSHDLDEDEAEKVKEVMEDLGLDEDDAVELAEEL